MTGATFMNDKRERVKRLAVIPGSRRKRPRQMLRSSKSERRRLLMLRSHKRRLRVLIL